MGKSDEALLGDCYEGAGCHNTTVQDNFDHTKSAAAIHLCAGLLWSLTSGHADILVLASLTESQDPHQKLSQINQPVSRVQELCSHGARKQCK